MKFMSDSDIEGAVYQFRSHPVLGPATRVLDEIRNMADRNSDGWCYWTKPVRACRKLMELIEGEQERARFSYPMRTAPATMQDLRKALVPVRAFCTRQGWQFPEVEVGMRDLTQTETVKLEELIDTTSITAVLEAIALIAEEKTDHIETSYSDPRLAKTWRSVASWLALASRKIGRALP